MAKTNRYYLNFALHFNDMTDLKKVINVTKRLVPRLRGLLGNRLANTAMIEQAKKGAEAFTSHNNVRVATPRMRDILNNFDATKQITKEGSHFFIFHKALEKDDSFTWTNPFSNKTHTTPKRLVLNFLQYGRRGNYPIPKRGTTGPTTLSFQYYGSRAGQGYHIRTVPPSKRIWVRKRKTWNRGMFDFVNSAIEEFVSNVRDEVASIIKSEGGTP